MFACSIYLLYILFKTCLKNARARAIGSDRNRKVNGKKPTEQGGGKAGWDSSVQFHYADMISLECDMISERQRHDFGKTTT